RIDRLVAAVVVRFDDRHAYRLRDARYLVEIPDVAGEVRIIDDPASIALEMAVIDRVEAHERREQPPVRLGDPRAREVAAGPEPIVEFVERVEQRDGGLLVRLLRRREARFVNAVIDV